MFRRACLAALLLALAAPSGATGATTASELVPGVTYTRALRWSPSGPFVLHVVTGPPPGGLYAFKPVLASNRVSGRETVTTMQRRFSRRATVVGVNGDFFGSLSGAPSGMFMRRGTLMTTPQRKRSTLGIAVDGALRVDRIWHASTWTVPGYPTMRIARLNKRLVRPGVALFTPAWGATTPAVKTAVDVVLAKVPKVIPGREVFATAVVARRGGGTPIPAGGAVLQAQGTDWTGPLVRRARPGRTVAIRIDLTNWWEDVGNAVGGGPVLVRDGVAIPSAGEGFTSYQLYWPHPRTAVGQLANGRLILVAVDGRSWFSVGLTVSDLAVEMARLGAVTAMALDGGGSTTMAFDGRVLNDPSDGSERRVANSLLLLYYGIYAPPPRYRTFSPNGDGVADVQSLSAKVVRSSTVDLALVQPDGAVAWRYAGPLGASTLSKQLTSPLLPEGAWRWIVYGLDNRGRESLMERAFTVNNTLGYLVVSKTRMAVNASTGGRLHVSVRLAHDAQLTFSIRNIYGQLVRQLYSGKLPPGTYGLLWNGKNDAGRTVKPGRYLVRAAARNELGRVSLQRRFLVVAES